MNLFNQYLYWYEFAQIITNKASTSKGKRPYKCLLLPYRHHMYDAHNR